MITYVLVDTRNQEVRYVGVTGQKLATGLSCHWCNRGRYEKWEHFQENWKGGWLAAIEATGQKPFLVPVATGNLERLFFDSLKAAGARIWNQLTPKPQRLLTYQPELGEKA